MVSRKKTARKKTAKPDKKTVIIIAVIAIIVIIAISMFLLKEPEDTGTDTGDSGRTVVVGSPEYVYLNYKKEFDASNSYNDYANVIRKYGTSGEIAKITEYDLISDEFRENIFNLAKTMAPSYSNLDLDNIQESISGYTATLIIDTKDGTMKGTIKMRKQNNVWKLEEDSWKNA